MGEGRHWPLRLLCLEKGIGKIGWLMSSTLRPALLQEFAQGHRVLRRGLGPQRGGEASSSLP